MREHFTQEILGINQDMQKMSVLVEENIRRSLKALTSQDAKLAKEAIAADAKVNELELAITDRCVLFIAKEQPVAGDLRHIVACLKAVSDIERIGDYAVHAAKRAKELADEKYIKPLVDIPKMLTLGLEMCRDGVGSLVNHDRALAIATAARDADMDNLNKQVNRELLALMFEDKDNIKQATKLQFLSRILERMGDHAVTICSWALYSVDGEHSEL
ncbi:MAG: phosphate signaling complex protein PhoU [Spirochaetales bacterium]